MSGERRAESETIEHHTATVLTVAVCHKDKLALSGCEDGRVSLFSLTDNTLVSSFTPDSSEAVNCVTFNCRETAKVYAAAGQQVFVYDTRRLGEVQDTFNFHEEEVNQVSVGEKGQYLVSCDDNGVVVCVDLTTPGGRCVSKHTAHDNICSSVQWIPGRTGEILTGGMDGKIHHRDLYKTRPIRTISEPSVEEGGYIVNPPFVYTLSTHWKSRYMVAGFISGSVRVWRLGSKKVGYVPTKSLPRHNSGTSCVCLVDSKTVVTGGNDGFVHVTDLEAGHSNGHSAELLSEEESDIKVDDSGTFKLLHGSKVNWLTGYRDCNQFYTLVCDQSNVVTKYLLR